MILHQKEDDFRELITATSEKLKIAEVFIEKDYFVMLSLKSLSENEDYRSRAIFKGGTSLTKAYKLISRFSEDIDIGLLNKDLEGVGNRNVMTQVNRVLTGHNSFTRLTFEEDERVKHSNYFKCSICRYSRVTSGEMFQASDVLKVELNRFTPSIPSEEMPLQTYIADFLETTEDGFKTIEEFELEKFNLHVMRLERTFVEKVLAMTKKSFLPDPMQLLKSKVRHFYDLHFLLKDQRVKDFLANRNRLAESNCCEFIARTLQDEYEGTAELGWDNSWMNNEFSDAIIFKELDKVWDELAKTYTEEFSPFVYGKLPSPEEIKETINLLKEIVLRFDKWRADQDFKLNMN